jgi:Ca2+-binding RTX toxin-like protein
MTGDDPMPPDLPDANLFRGIRAEHVRDMAWMSDLAYGDGGLLLADLLSERGWQPLTQADLRLDPADLDGQGYYDVNDGQGFVAVGGSTLAIVFRGSVDNDDLVKSAFDQQAVVRDLRPMVHQALAWAQENPFIDTIYITGQSLGAALAGNFAAKIDEFPQPGQAVQFEVVGFGSPGSEVDDRNDLTRNMLEVNHGGDPVPTDPLLSRLDHHGITVRVELPLMSDANSFVDLANQKLDGRITEHDSETYRQSTDAIAGSPLYGYTAQEMPTAVLGLTSDDVYQVRDATQFTLGAGGNDMMWGSVGTDLLDGGAGGDLIFGEPMDVLLSRLGGDPALGGDDDLLAGDIGSDVLFGGGGRDLFVCAPASGGGTDRIGAFTVGIDDLDLRAFMFTDYLAQVAPLITQGAEGAVVSLSLFDGEDVILAGLDAVSLGPDDFLL